MYVKLMERLGDRADHSYNISNLNGDIEILEDVSTLCSIVGTQAFHTLCIAFACLLETLSAAKTH